MNKTEIEKAAEEKYPSAFCETGGGIVVDKHCDIKRAAYIEGITDALASSKKIDIEKLRDEYKIAYHKIMGYHVDFGLDNEGHKSNGERLFDFFKPHLTNGKEKIDIDWAIIRKEFKKWDAEKFALASQKDIFEWFKSQLSQIGLM